MAQLVVLLPARRRTAGAHAGASASAATAAVSWVLSADGQRIDRQGRSLLAELPPAHTLILLVPPSEIAWHRIDLPRAPAARLQAALAGVLEERLLEDPDQLQFALAPGARPAEPTWVAVIHRPWLQEWLAALAAQQRVVDQAVPWLAPGGLKQAHALRADDEPADDPAAGVRVLAMSPDSALMLPLAGAASIAWLQPWREAEDALWSCSPAAALAAERLLGRPVPVRSDAEMALAAASQGWPLLQFDLAPRRRGLRALAQALHALRTPAWRPLRWGAVALVAVNLIGLNAHAWQQRRALDAQRARLEATLREAHPQVRAVLDAPVQMRTETARLRERAGVPDGDDLESLLGALARAWPPGVPPPPDWQYAAGRLSLPQSALPAAAAEVLRQGLSGSGHGIQADGGRWVMARRGETGAVR